MLMSETVLARCELHRINRGVGMGPKATRIYEGFGVDRSGQKGGGAHQVSACINTGW